MANTHHNQDPPSYTTCTVVPSVAWGVFLYGPGMGIPIYEAEIGTAIINLLISHA